MTDMPPTFRVFISYAWTDEAANERVRAVADRLQEDGIEVLLDRYDLREGDDKFAYMERSVSDKTVTKVLIMCSPTYKRKADQRQGGVGHESTILSPVIYAQVTQEGRDTARVIPIIMETDAGPESVLPAMLASKMYIDLSSDELLSENYEQLTRAIANRPLLQKPPLGQLPAHLLAEPQVTSLTSGVARAFRSAVERGRTSQAQGALQTYLDRVLEVLTALPHAVTNHHLDPQVTVAQAQAFAPYLAEWAQLLEYRCLNAPEIDLVEPIRTLFERSLPLTAWYTTVRGGTSFFDGQFDPVRFVVRTLFVVLHAVLIKHRRFSEAVEFLNAPYFFDQGPLRAVTYEPYTAFDFGLETLRGEEETANLTMSILPVAQVSKSAYLQTDILLTIRSLLNLPETTYWYPRSNAAILGQAVRLELLERAVSRRRFPDLAMFLGVNDKQELISRWQAVSPQYKAWINNPASLRRGLASSLNFDNLEKVP